ncbi:ComEC family competence protein [Candidatus Parcubacteria bacterium]|nr:ComEC family competence protein [Candidatus Parcubacteria bacterium]
MDQGVVTDLYSKGILLFIFSFAFGIACSSFVFISPVISVFLLIIAFGIIVSEKVWKGSLDRGVIFISIVLFAFALGSLRYAVKDFHEDVSPLTSGVVVGEPEARDNATRFVFKSDNGERVLVNTDLYSNIQYGDRVNLSGKLEKPGKIVDDSGRSFDYAKYLSKDDIYYTMSFAKVEVLEHGLGNPIKERLFKIKSNFINHIKSNFAEPYASLLAGLLVSGREAMPKDILEEFRRAGIIHIVVLSGYNITIIADFLKRLLEKFFLLTRIPATPILSASTSIVGVILFVLMTGAPATVVRAALMVMTVILARLMGRKFSASRALLTAAFIMLLENPKILIFDPSFQLSFLATLALIYVVPIVEKYLKRLPNGWGFRTTVATTIGTQLTVLPLLIYSMGDVSLVSLPTNVLVLPIIPYVMFTGFLATTLSYISSFVALPLVYLTHLILVWILWVSHFFGNLAFATVKIF